MDKLKTAKDILANIGMPQQQQSDLCALALLGLAKLKENDAFEEATNGWMRIHDVIQFINENYNTTYAENTRETFRKQAMHNFRNAALIEDNGMATNSPNYKYRIAPEFLQVIKTVGTTKEEATLKAFNQNHEKLIDVYASKRSMPLMPVKINDKEFVLSPGAHNKLQRAILEEFAPRFAPNSECLYTGDTTNKGLVKNAEKLSGLGFEITAHDKMPDVILYRNDKNWLYFIEAADSVGPMSAERVLDINNMTKNVVCGKIFVTAFWDFKKYKRFSEQLAWDTEVWIAEMPDHMIHLNGDKFLGPRNQ